MKTDLKFEIDVSKLDFLEWRFPKEFAEAQSDVMDHAMELFEQHWRSNISNDLSARQQVAYLEGVTSARLTPTSAEFVLSGAYPCMIEEGTPGFDQRDVFLRPQGLDKRVIPFEHSAPHSTGAVPPPMGAAYRQKMGAEAAEKLGQSIFAKASALRSGVRVESPPGSRKYKTAVRGQLMRKSGAEKLFERHSTDLYTRMGRFEQSSGGASSSTYITFRTIFEDASAEKWQYPQKDGKHLLDKTLQTFSKEITEFVNTLYLTLLEKVEKIDQSAK